MFLPYLHGELARWRRPGHGRIATFSYRKTSHVEVSDSAKAVRWLKRHKLLDCFRVPAPEVAKNEVKKLINAGTKVPGCAVVEDYSCQLK